jgi:serine/threonine protein kinase/tetratricopeptide (TPR) repeat protein
MWSVFFIHHIMPYRYGSFSQLPVSGRPAQGPRRCPGPAAHDRLQDPLSMRSSIGRYAVTGTLGEGGMGVVYSASDDRLGRPVAIKMIKAAVAEPAARDRLRREARSAASVNHPAICQLYEIGEEEGELFLAMELLQGESLAARIGRGSLPLGEAVSTAIGFLNGLDALHRHNLVHRDLKPSNIFLTPHGIKLLDFGLTCSVEAAADETLVRVTAPGTIVGTPQYAAPEQLRGGTGDARTDLFASGVVLYEMLAGKPPFSGHTAIEVFHAIMYEQPPVLTGGPAVAALDRVVHRAVAKRPEERYQTAGAMMQDLRDALVLGDTGSTIPTYAVTRLIVLPFRMLRPDPETDFLAFSLADAVTSSLSGLQSLVVRSSLAASRFASDSPDLKAIANSAEVDAVLVGTLMRAGDQLRVATQLIETPSSTVLWSHTAQVSVGDLFRLQDELTGRIVESLSLPLTTRERRMLKQDVPSSARAYEHYLRANEMSRDTRQWRAALDRYEECVREDPHYAPAWSGIGRMHRLIGKYEEAEETRERFAKAEAALKRALDLNPDLSVAENLYAHLEVDLGRAEQSMVRLLRRARDRSADPELFAGLSHACRYCGLLQASLAAAEQARRLDPKIRVSAGHTCFMLGEYARVLEFEPEDSFMRNLVLLMLGRNAEALAGLDVMDSPLPHRLEIYVTALHQLLRKEDAESLVSIRKMSNIGDPEGRFYVARHLAYLGDRDGALALLDHVVKDGFFCLPALKRDPWLDPLRGTAEFAAVLHHAESRHRQAVISFLTAEGDRVLGITHPV